MSDMDRAGGIEGSQTGEARSTVQLEVEEALGPGFEVAIEHGVARIVGGRAGTLWLGLDRAHVVESDAGDGTGLAAVVAVPASSFAGCRIEAELIGAWLEGERAVLVARLGETALPPAPFVRTVARVGETARWVDTATAGRLTREARARHRTRRGESRMVGGRAWQPPQGLDPGVRRFTTPHSQAEYRLDRLPPRFLRGLEGLLDADERIIYAIERPPAEASLFDRARGARDLRAALLLLTDRQLLWLVDHMPPNRYLLDWGVDARLVALETLRDVGIAPAGRNGLEIRVGAPGGGAAFGLPAELRAEADVMVDLLRRFVGGAGTRLPQRRYAIEALAFDPEPSSRFDQLAEARALVTSLETALAPEEAIGRFYAPRREHVPEAMAVVLSGSRVLLARAPAATGRRRRGDRPGETTEVGLASLRSLSLSLSPLVGRLELDVQSVPGRRPLRAAFSYPAPLADQAAPFIRQLRRAWANAQPPGGAPSTVPVPGGRPVAPVGGELPVAQRDAAA